MGLKAIEVKSLTYYYPNSQIPALDDVSLDIDYGEFVVIAGPSGGGKSTLCRVLVGLIPHVYGGEITGSVLVDGVDVVKGGVKSVIGRIGVVFQNPENQVVNLIVEEELAFGLENLGLDPKSIEERVEEVSEALSLRHLLGRATSSLSGGELQKVVLASVLAMKPRLLLLDEPLAHLDPASEQRLIQLLKSLRDEMGITIVVFEHRLAELLKHVDNVVVLNRRVVYQGRPGDVVRDLLHTGVEVPPVAELFIDSGESVPLSVEEALTQLKDVTIKGFSQASMNARSSLLSNNESLGNESAERAYIIEARNVWFKYRNGVEALKGVDLKIENGALIALIGANGAGKTTLIKHLNGLLKPLHGDVIVCGKNTKNHSVAELSNCVGVVFQNPLHQFFCDTVLEEAAFAAKIRGDKDPYEKARQLLERFGLLHALDRSPFELSAGEQRRLAIASVLIYEPPVIALDEPTASLDGKSKLELLAVIKDLLRRGKTVIIATHDVEFLAKAKPDKVVLLNEGRVLAEGSPREVLYRVELLEKSMVVPPQIVRLVKALGLDKVSRPLDAGELRAHILGGGV